MNTSNPPVVVFKNMTLVSLCMVLHDMPNTVIENTNLTNCHFKLIEMQRSGFDKVVFTDATFDHCNLDGSILKSCDFTNAVFSETVMTDCSFEKIDFNKARLASCSFSQSGMINVSLKESVLIDVDFSGTTLSHVDFTDADFDHKSMNFEQTIFKNCLMSEKDMAKLNLTDLQKSGIRISQNQPDTQQTQVRERIPIEVKIPINK